MKNRYQANICKKIMYYEDRYQVNMCEKCLLGNTFSLSISLLANICEQTCATNICVSKCTFSFRSLCSSMNTKLHDCGKCDFQTKHLGNLARHNEFVHQNIKSCDMCPYRTGSIWKLFDHKKTAHIIKVKDKVCGVCDYRTSQVRPENSGPSLARARHYTKYSPLHFRTGAACFNWEREYAATATLIL